MVSTGDELLMWGGFGGSATGTEYLTDMWRYRKDGWEEIAGVTAPAGYRACAAWDSDRHVAVSFGGVTAAGVNAEVHEYDPQTGQWTWLHPVGEKPAGRLGGAMTYIPGYGCLMTGGTVGGDETWLWNGVAWRQIADSTPEAVSVHSIVWDPVRGRAVQFAGLHGMESLDSVWEFDPVSEMWSRVFPAPGPAPRHLQSFAWVPKLGVVVGYGRVVDPRRPLFQDLWAWDGSAWTQLEMDEAAAPRFCSQTAWLPSLGLVMFGGETTESPDPDSTFRTGDTTVPIKLSTLHTGFHGDPWWGYP